MGTRIIYIFQVRESVDGAEYWDSGEENTVDSSGRNVKLILLSAAGMAMIWVGFALILFLLKILAGLIVHEAGLVLILASLIILRKKGESSIFRVAANIALAFTLIWALVIAMAMASIFLHIQVFATIFITSPSFKT